MYVENFNNINSDDIDLVGGKNSSLGEMLEIAQDLKITVPNGYAITTNTYIEYINCNNILSLIEEVDKTDDLKIITKLSKKIQILFITGTFPNKIKNIIIKFYIELSKRYNTENVDVAVRSSSTAEDLPSASFAGQQDTYLNIHGIESLILHIKKCMASLFNVRAIHYRKNLNVTSQQVKISVGIQKMARSDLGSSGVAFSLDPESGNKMSLLSIQHLV